LKKLLLSCCLLLCLLQPALAQTGGCRLRISLLTCAPGTELYSTFGHTAIRVWGPGFDEVYNYGTFEFAPDFYSKFIRGKLLYALSVERFDDFVAQYRFESRTVVEQELLAGCAEKETLYRALVNNAREANRYYRYDFLFDNCTTRAKDMLAKHAGDTVVFRNMLPAEKLTFRHLIHRYLHKGAQHWSQFGIDLLLGSPLDRQVTNDEAMFLPENLMKGLEGARMGAARVVSDVQPVMTLPSPLDSRSVFTPLVVFTLLLVLVAALGFRRHPQALRVLAVFDRSFFLLLGLTGILLVFMWAGTDHTVCRYNYNLLWAFPLHAVAVFFLGSRRSWVPLYFRATALVAALLLAGWFFLPQQFNTAVIPILLLIILRSFSIAKRKDYAGKNH